MPLYCTGTTSGEKKKIANTTRNHILEAGAAGKYWVDNLQKGTDYDCMVSGIELALKE
jgi:hypothetical protein